ncbi:MAG: peptide chain release factor 1 [Pseudomonadota bacterium]
MLPLDKLRSLMRRHEEVEQLLCDPGVLADPKRLNALNRERGQLLPIVETMRKLELVERTLVDDRAALDDPELGPIAREEIPSLEAEREKLEHELKILLLPRDPNDDRNTILEVRAGTGGEEAALFAADLFRMYARYAERRGWRVEILSTSEASAGGLKEVIALISGDRVYSRLKHEGGVHRVQRVPETEAQGRIHTSTATVAVLPEAEEVDLEIDERDLKIDIAAAGGPGGQGVNTTNSAVQITHLPSGITVKCQDERSQIKNRAKAMKILRSRLLEIEREKQAEQQRDERRGMVKGGDRSEKIRTYNFPQNRLTDHRIGLTLYELDRVIEGELDQLIDALAAHHQAAQLERQEGGAEPS